MPIVNTNIIKEWFSNFKKPPQEQFWVWLDSFRHKWEKVPLNDVEGLTGILQKKADLVDGVVPEDQLPFSVVTSEIITLGTVSILDNKLKLAVHSSGQNKVRVKGKTIIRTFPNQWTFTPIEGNGVKVIRGFAVRNEDDFFISEGAELPDFELPEIPPDALQIFMVTITSSGAIIDSEDFGSYKLENEDNWRTITINGNNPQNIMMTLANSFNLQTTDFATSPKISGMTTKLEHFTRDGQELHFYNDSSKPVEFVAGDYTPGVFTTFGFKESFVLQPKKHQKFKRRNNLYEVLPGSANFPEVGNNRDVLVKTADGEAWSNRLTTAETAINTEVTNRTAADVILQNNINANTTAISAEVTARIAGDLAVQVQKYKTISGNVNLDDSYHNSIVWINANSIITVISTLRADFNCVFFVVGNFTGTITNGAGVTLIQPYGLIIYPNSTAMLHRYVSNQFILYM